MVFRIVFKSWLVVKIRRPRMDFSPLYTYNYMIDIAVVRIRADEQNGSTSGGRKARSCSKGSTGGSIVS